MISAKPRVRFAPSPTGYLHVGGARTAFYNYLFAKNKGGAFILRIEDTDEARSTEESLKMVLHDLMWLGLNWDEGPHPESLSDVGPYGPYKQSQRLSFYKQVADELIQKGLAYYCFMTDQEIEEQKKKAESDGKIGHLQSPYESWSLEKSQELLDSGKKAVVRFKTRGLKKDFHFKDLVRGDITFPSDMVGDWVLLRSDGMPVYNFCCAVDDYKMKITHVLRAEEHLSNTLRQLMIFEAMNWEKPEFGHLSVVLDEDKQKMSKRKGATSCFQFMEEGYLPEALLNFIVLLGWSHPEEKEILSRDEMIRSFSTDRLNPSGAVFDGVKLKWMNAQYLRALPDLELWSHVEKFLKKEGLVLPYDDKDWAFQSLQTFKTHMEVFSDAPLLYSPLDDTKFAVAPEAMEVLNWEPTKAVLEKWLSLLESHNSEKLTESDFVRMESEVKATGVKGKNLFQPIRVAVIGKPQGPELKILVPLMRRSSLIKRAQTVLRVGQ
jgi:nondiscriminating glutamyl-tRNA synthetase